MGYRIKELSDGFWKIMDHRGNTAYLIQGERKTLLVDTAMDDEPIVPIIRTLTDKPVILALTHMHLDHMYRCDEFDKVHVHEMDIADWKNGLGKIMQLSFPLFKVKPKRFHADKFVPLYDDSEIDLGGFAVKCLRVSGHTRGSVLFIDSRHRAVLCGDAAGLSMWLFLPYCTDVSTYKQNLENAEQALSPYKSYSFYRGHSEPEGMPPEPLSIQTFTDMRMLCEKLLAGTADIKRIDRFRWLPLFYTKNASAGMVVREGKIK